MKRFGIIAFIMALVLILSVFAGCGADNTASTTTAENTVENTTSQADNNTTTQKEEENVISTTDVSDKSTTEPVTEPQKSEPDVDNGNENDNNNETNNGSQNDNETEPPVGDYTGSFTSDTGTALNVVVKWAAVKLSDDTYKVTFRFFVKSYDLYVSERYDLLTVKTSSLDKSIGIKTEEILKSDGVFGESFLGEVAVPFAASDLSEGLESSFVWNFRGTYSGVQLDSIEASGTVKIS